MKKYWCNRVVQVGSEFENIDVAMGNFIPFASMAGMRNGELGGRSWDTSKPHVVILDKFQKKYIMQTDFTVQTFRSFITNFLAGSIKSFVEEKHDEL